MMKEAGVCSNRSASVCFPVKVQKSDHPHSWDPCVNNYYPPNSALCNTSSTLNKSWTASNNNTINSVDYCKCKTAELESSPSSSSSSVSRVCACSAGISQLLSQFHHHIWTQQPELQHAAPAGGSHEPQKLTAQTTTEKERPQKLP